MTNYLFSTVKQAKCSVTITPEEDETGADIYLVKTKQGNVTTTLKYFTTDETMIANSATLATGAILQPAQGSESPQHYIVTDTTIDRFEDFNG
jgi:hypothetical protein